MKEVSITKQKKRERFLKVVPKRVDSILKRIQVLANCASKGTYDYTPEQVEKIFDAIEKQLKIARERFHTGRETIKLTREDLEQP